MKRPTSVVSLEGLAEKFKQQQISRRQFIEGAVALGVPLLAAQNIVQSARAETPKRGGHFRIGVGQGSTTDQLDPATYVTPFTIISFAFGIGNQLVEINHSGEAVPELSESFEPSSDAKVWRFKLRKGVEFHNGKTLDVNDVITSINHHRGADSKSAIKAVLSSIADIKADGDTVVFSLTDGNADFPYAVSDYHLPIFQAKDGRLDWQSGIGTGGYKLKKFDPGVAIELERNPNYFKSDRAHFDSCSILSLTDSTARLNALASGEVDAIDQVERKTSQMYSQQPGIVLLQTTGSLHYTFPMNTTLAPFDNNDVRLALKYAVDREAMVAAILFGTGRVANDQPIGPANRFYAADLEQRKYDPEKARFHLKKAGLETLKVELFAADSAFAGAPDAALLFADAAAKCGIEITVNKVPNDGYWDNIWMKKPFTSSYWAGRPTEDLMFTTAYAAGGAWNETFWSNEAFMKLLKEARSELNTDKRRTMYAEMQRLVRDDGGAVIPMFANFLDAHSDKISHGPVASNWATDGWRPLERWWFA